MELAHAVISNIDIASENCHGFPRSVATQYGNVDIVVTVMLYLVNGIFCVQVEAGCLLALGDHIVEILEQTVEVFFVVDAFEILMVDRAHDLTVFIEPFKSLCGYVVYA